MSDTMLGLVSIQLSLQNYDRCPVTLSFRDRDDEGEARVDRSERGS